MGNCLKGITDSSLLEPLTMSDNIDNQDERIHKLENEIEQLKQGMVLLEKNTTQNLKLISEDLHYINTKIISDGYTGTNSNSFD